MGYGVDRTPVKVTPGEAILPIKTTKALGVGNIRRLIQQTTGKSPKVGVRAGGKYATGESPADDTAYNTGQAINTAVSNAGHAIANAGGDYIAQTIADTKPVVQFVRGAVGASSLDSPETAPQVASKNINPTQASPLNAGAPAKNAGTPAINAGAGPDITNVTPNVIKWQEPNGTPGYGNPVPGGEFNVTSANVGKNGGGFNVMPAVTGQPQLGATPPGEGPAGSSSEYAIPGTNNQAHVYGYGVGGNADVGVGNSTTPQQAKVQEGIQAEKAARKAMYDQEIAASKAGVLPEQLLGGGAHDNFGAYPQQAEQAALQRQAELGRTGMTEAGANERNAATIAAETPLRSAQALEATQKSHQEQQIMDLQNEMSAPGTTKARQAQIAETIGKLRGIGDTYKPMSTVDVNGNPTALYNQYTGEKKEAEPSKPNDLQHFLAVAKAQPGNAGKSDKELTDYYNKTYGGK